VAFGGAHLAASRPGRPVARTPSSTARRPPVISSVRIHGPSTSTMGAVRAALWRACQPRAPGRRGERRSWSAVGLRRPSSSMSRWGSSCGAGPSCWARTRRTNSARQASKTSSGHCSWSVIVESSCRSKRERKARAPHRRPALERGNKLRSRSARTCSAWRWRRRSAAPAPPARRPARRGRGRVRAARRRRRCGAPARHRRPRRARAAARVAPPGRREILPLKRFDSNLGRCSPTDWLHRPVRN
jgi:hypothetical protein